VSAVGLLSGGGRDCLGHPCDDRMSRGCRSRGLVGRQSLAHPLSDTLTEVAPHVVVARGLHIVWTQCASVNLAAFVHLFESEFDVFVDVELFI